MWWTCSSLNVCFWLRFQSKCLQHKGFQPVDNVVAAAWWFLRMENSLTLKNSPRLIGQSVPKMLHVSCLTLQSTKANTPGQQKMGSWPASETKCIRRLWLGQIAGHISQCVPKRGISGASLAQQWTCSGTCFCIWPRLIHMGQQQKSTGSWPGCPFHHHSQDCHSRSKSYLWLKTRKFQKTGSANSFPLFRTQRTVHILSGNWWPQCSHQSDAETEALPLPIPQVPAMCDPGWVQCKAMYPRGSYLQCCPKQLWKWSIYNAFFAYRSPGRNKPLPLPRQQWIPELPLPFKASHTKR